MKLLLSQKNRLFDVINYRGLNPNLFLYKEASSLTDNAVIELKSTEYFYRFETNSLGSHAATYSPGEDTIVERENPGSWEYQLKYFNQWLGYISRELQQPDKWKQLEDALLNANFQDINFDDTKFTHQEYKVLEKNLSDLKQKISKLDLLEDQVKQIDKKLDHLLILAKDLNKTDWKDLFIGSFISLIITLSVDKSTGIALLGYAKEIFSVFLPQLK